MKEQDIIQNTLLSLKHLKSFFNTFSQEASNAEVYKCVDDAYIDVSQLQRDCFQLMLDQGWYKIQNQTKAAIQKEYKKFENKEC